jgi:hypothetical protein
VPDGVVIGEPVAIAQIVARGGSEQHGVLRHIGHAQADFGRVGAGQRDAVDADCAAFGIVEALRQLEQSRLARARRADHRDGFAGADLQAEIIERRYFWPGGIAEVHILELKLPARRDRQGDRFGRRGDIGLCRQQFGKTARGACTADQIAIDFGQCPERTGNETAGQHEGRDGAA